MQTTSLTSFVTIALVAVTSSFAIVVRSPSQVTVPSLTLPGPSLPAQNDLPVAYQSRRHTTDTLDKDIDSIVDVEDDKKVTDAQVLNFALSLELLERAFYERGLSRYSKEDFKNAGYPRWVRGRMEQIYEHEKTHVQFLESALTSAGDEYVQPCEYIFNDKSPREFIDLSEALESVGTSAYTGALQYISDDVSFLRSSFMALLMPPPAGLHYAAVSILTTEARHASWMNSAVRKQNPWNTAFETPLTVNQAYTLASNFIKPDSCPKSNDALLPRNIHAYSQLTLAPKLIPGQEAQVTFTQTVQNEQERLYVAFLSGAATIFAPLNKKEEHYFVDIPEDLKDAGTVFVVVFKGGEDIKEARLNDRNTVAGPAIAVFPFDSRGKYPLKAGDKKKHGSH